MKRTKKESIYTPTVTAQPMAQGYTALHLSPDAWHALQRTLVTVWLRALRVNLSEPERLALRAIYDVVVGSPAPVAPDAPAGTAVAVAGTPDAHLYCSQCDAWVTPLTSDNPDMRAGCPMCWGPVLPEAEVRRLVAAEDLQKPSTWPTPEVTRDLDWSKPYTEPDPYDPDKDV